MSERALQQAEWRHSRNGTLDVAGLTAGRPFCAGVLVVENGSLLTTLSSVHGPAVEQEGREWWIGGVGGGQEPGEDPWATASREALEELAVDVELVTSPVTHVQDLDESATWTTTSTDQVAPFAVQRISNTDATRPFKPGLPAGPYTYFTLFLARLAQPGSRLDPSGDSDIAALLWVPLRQLEELCISHTTFATLEASGARAASGEVDPRAVVHLSSTESLAHLAAPLTELLPRRTRFGWTVDASVIPRRQCRLPV